MTERQFNEFLVKEYFRLGSVDEALRHNDLPISYAGYQRVLDKWGIVKAAGPNSRLSEAFSFLIQLAEESVTLEALYKKMPASFQTSVSTLHRILSYVKEGVTRRVCTALVLTPYNDLKKILIAKDISTPRIELGKPSNSLSLPMGFSSKSDLVKESVLRVLQQEIFTDLAVARKIPKNLIPEKIRPFVYLDVVDVRVAVYHINLPKTLTNIKSFSSYKLIDFQFMPVQKIIRSHYLEDGFRAGVPEIVHCYQKTLEYQKRGFATNPIYIKSNLNQKLLGLQVQ